MIDHFALFLQLYSSIRHSKFGIAVSLAMMTLRNNQALMC